VATMKRGAHELFLCGPRAAVCCDAEAGFDSGRDSVFSVGQ
jgi:hypothetical protein